MRLNFTQNVRSALRALLANKLRSALTMLGIVIGVGAVVALLSIGTGAQASITSRIEGIGANLITVFAGSRNNFAPGGGGRRDCSLDLCRGAAIARLIRDRRRIAASAIASAAQER